MPGKYIYSASELPQGRHWAIIGSDSTYVPGDQRSIDAPGHGYPAHTDPYITYRAYTNEVEFRSDLEVAFKRNDRVLGIEVAGIYNKLITYEIKRNL